VQKKVEKITSAGWAVTVKKNKLTKRKVRFGKTPEMKEWSLVYRNAGKTKIRRRG
jgi:hypothetical protein